MKASGIGAMVVDGAVELHRDLGCLPNFGEALMRDGITRIIHGTLDVDPPCLGASVRKEFIEPGGPPTRLHRVGDRGCSTDDAHHRMSKPGF